MSSPAKPLASSLPTMCWELNGRIFVIVHSKHPPADPDYDAALNGYARHLGDFDGILISTAGGGPNFAQRKRTLDFWEGKVPPTTVVMTSLQVTRGIITAMNWFRHDSPIIATAFDDFVRAFDYLHVSPARRTDLQTAVTRLHKAVQS